ncbi:DUF4212 domain-containing protein [Halanaeroarchaeum sulfurireducens]|uniref:Sodium symporter small subunit domain-containing protein n=1 Tax=Halanaeroarchaeum sulfurireducens TaxID=1604004 RepID=A0A0F7PC09_9EURY|nr:DUF4212 domain-containing protein [Halanaeroarchaeum sulfurireducens]AKH96903.1 hypothetical protein HLASF_0397 [Halanaeroarchaeum sulfurireducens]ALG81305.1 hypothetical protein HLASA_0396 [Halanaeroarchaeum sulfurireducens]
MNDSPTHETATDGGHATDTAQEEQDVDYLETEINMLSPGTPFMRDNLRLIWTGFIIWAIVIFGPVTATKIAPGPMSTPMPILGFPLHYFLIAIGAVVGALGLSAWYARRRDQLDEKYGIDHSTPAEPPSGPGGGEH